MKIVMWIECNFNRSISPGNDYLCDFMINLCAEFACMKSEWFPLFQLVKRSSMRKLRTCDKQSRNWRRSVCDCLAREVLQWATTSKEYILVFILPDYVGKGIPETTRIPNLW